MLEEPFSNWKHAACDTCLNGLWENTGIGLWQTIVLLSGRSPAHHGRALATMPPCDFKPEPYKVSSIISGIVKPDSCFMFSFCRKPNKQIKQQHTHTKEHDYWCRTWFKHLEQFGINSKESVSSSLIDR